jgi:D-threo-aldose 1-dehydrogenase
MPVYPSLPTLKFVLKLRPLVCVYGAGILAGLRALREAGRIDEVSLGMNMVVAPQILRLLREAPEGTFDNIMLAHGWNLLCQDGLEVVQECTARGIRIHNAGVFCSGLLVGGDTYFYGKAAPEIIEKAKAW